MGVRTRHTQSADNGKMDDIKANQEGHNVRGHHLNVKGFATKGTDTSLAKNLDGLSWLEMGHGTHLFDGTITVMAPGRVQIWGREGMNGDRE